MDPERGPLVSRLRQRLLSDAPAAGWGYYTGKASRIEPTCWALLALEGSAAPATDPVPNHAAHLGFLTGLQDRDGLLIETEPGLANLASNGLAAIVLARTVAHATMQTALGRLLTGLAGVKGVRLEQNDPAQDNHLQGWPWVRDTFSWVEPTAWCLLALKIAQSGKPEARDRIREAEALMLNRVCKGGGWNYGNASTLGQDLRAYVPTTAVGLMAMQDRVDDASIEQSIRQLSSLRLSERSTLALSLAAMALRLHGQPAADVEEELSRAVVRSESSGQLMPIAMALFALTADQHRMEALRVRA